MSTLRKSHIVAWLSILGACMVVFGIVGASPVHSDPFRAAYIDNQTHSIAENSDLWFKFDYGLANAVRSVTSLTMVNGNHSGVRYEVWAGEIVGDWWERHPTGRGTAATIDCDTGMPSENGECQSNDLTWAGSFGAFGTYYVRVVNENAAPSAFLLVIQGDSVTLGPVASVPVPQVAPSAAAVPKTPTPVVAAVSEPRDGPGFAVGIDGISHSLPASGATWYRFEYGISDYTSRPLVSLRLANGMVTGIRFEVWAGENTRNWWERTPVGRGTQEILVNCYGSSPNETATPEGDEPTPTPEPTSTPTGKCATNDLTWTGAFGAAGTYYVRVINDSGSQQSYALTLTR